MTDNKAPQMSADDRIIALLDMTEQQSQAVEKLLAFLGEQAEQSQKNQDKYNAHADTLEDKTKKAVDSIEALAGKVYTQSQITKKDVTDSLVVATVYAVKNELGGSISQDLKNAITERVSLAIDDLFNEPFKADIQVIRNELAELKKDILAIKSNEIKAVQSFNAELVQGAREIAGETLGEFKGELQGATSDFKSIVSNLDGLARMGTKQIRPILEGFENVEGVLKGHSYLFTGIFCLVWFIVCLIGSGIYTSINKATDQDRQEVQQLALAKQAMTRDLATINYEYKDNKTYMPVDTSDCHDNFGKRFCAKK